MDEGTAPQSGQLVATWDAPRSYKRICVATEADIRATYPLIVSYLQNPELASTVDDFVADETRHSRASIVRWSDRDTNAPTFDHPTAAQVSDEAHLMVKSYVQALELGERTTQLMLEALDWKKRQLLEDAVDSPRGYDTHNQEYASTARVILLSLCKNVTKLYLGTVGKDTPLQIYLLKSNYEAIQQPGLRRLKSIQIVPFPERMFDNRIYKELEWLDYFRYFHRLPQLESVTMDGFAEDNASRELFPAGTSTIKQLHIEHTDISSSMLGTILRLPQALEEVHVQSGGLWTVTGGSPYMLPKTLGKALLEHKSTLRVLELDVGGDPPGIIVLVPPSGGRDYEREDPVKDGLEAAPGEPDPYAGEKDEYYRLDVALSLQNRPPPPKENMDTKKYGYTIGSFHDFTALTHLSIEQKLLFGPSKRGTGPLRNLAELPPTRLLDTLPPNLEYFCLYNYKRGVNIDVDELVDEFTEQRSSRFPLLDKVVGISETVKSEAAEYGHRMKEQDLWEWPKLDIGWAQV
ncbi:hypothetical protein BX600DRAFT_461200 [Xylariales sp. PMI_506]|nr:hypothetical protein BX600DRAFT_461200 [Xylariales sp. PMI_506]